MNDYAPFVTYMLGVLAAAYRDFESRIELLTTKGLSKPDRVREIIKNHLGKITKSEIMAKWTIYGVCLEWRGQAVIFTW